MKTVLYVCMYVCMMMPLYLSHMCPLLCMFHVCMYVCMCVQHDAGLDLARSRVSPEHVSN